MDFSVLAEDLDVVTLRTSSANGNMSFWQGKNVGWMDIWALNS
jgi:hypothetical protein